MSSADVLARLPRLRTALALASLTSLVSISSPARASGAVLPARDRPLPTFLDARVAVAATPSGATRWHELTVPYRTKALWIVPAKPGAVVDWVPRRFLDALDNATRPRVIAPDRVTDCSVRASAETAAPFTTTAPSEGAFGVTIATSANDLLAQASARGYFASSAFVTALDAFYASGWNALLVEVETGDATLTTRTLRVTDDAGGVLPVALSSGLRMTTFTIGSGSAMLPGADVAPDLAGTDLRWGLVGSNYADWREDALSGGRSWAREAHSHAMLFEQTSLGGTATPSVVDAYFTSSSCAASAESVRALSGNVGTVCAPGTGARVPGGTSCEPSSGAIDPSALTCGDQIDMALAFSSATPRTAVVTRWASRLPGNPSGSDLAIAFAPAASHGPLFRAWDYEACPPLPPSPSPPQPPPSRGSSGYEASGDVPITVSEGCGSSATYVEEEPPPSSSEGCSSDSTSSEGWDSDDESDDDGWDSDDDASSDSSSSSDSNATEGCSGSDDSSETDSCSSSTPSGDDGWDTEDEMSPKNAKHHAAHRPHRKRSSPVSRLALLAVAVLLPFRRRGRPSNSSR